jgi:hypothetical protein
MAFLGQNFDFWMLYVLWSKFLSIILLKIRKNHPYQNFTFMRLGWGPLSNQEKTLFSQLSSLPRVDFLDFLDFFSNFLITHVITSIREYKKSRSENFMKRVGPGTESWKCKKSENTLTLIEERGQHFWTQWLLKSVSVGPKEHKSIIIPKGSCSGNFKEISREVRYRPKQHSPEYNEIGYLENGLSQRYGWPLILSRMHHFYWRIFISTLEKHNKVPKNQPVLPKRQNQPKPQILSIVDESGMFDPSFFAELISLIANFSLQSLRISGKS